MDWLHDALTDPPGMATRSLKSAPAKMTKSTFSDDQIKALNIISIVVQSISMALGFVCFYWFMRMKRSFRHHLILLLLCCDVAKCFWFFIYPVVTFTGHKITSTSAFCQVQGFFLAFSLELSDFAILVIALHAVIYIFRPPQRMGQGGVYRYRYWIYALWIILPLLAASLAFVNPAGAYGSSGTYCFLPKRPFWYRLALSWVPRYVILLTIFVGYAAIYIYVHRKFKGFSSVSIGAALLRVHPSENDPGVSTMNSVRANTSLAKGGGARKQNDQTQATEPPRQVSPAWEKVGFITAPQQGQVRSEAEDDKMKHHRVDSGKGLAESPNSDNTTRPAKPDRTWSSSPTADSGNTDDTYVAPPQDQESSAPPDMVSTRIAIQRQLRFLFIYPIVYFILWTPAFANHCIQYNDYLAYHPPYWLSVLTIVTINIQTGTDAVIFMWRERPWQRVQHSKSGWAFRLKGQVAENFVHPEHKSSSEESRPPMDRGVSARTVEWWEREESLNEEMDELASRGSRQAGEGSSAV